VEYALVQNVAAVGAAAVAGFAVASDGTVAVLDSGCSGYRPNVVRLFWDQNWKQSLLTEKSSTTNKSEPLLLTDDTIKLPLSNFSIICCRIY